MNIFLDLDGTLLSIKNKYVFAHKEACRGLGLNPVSPGIYWEHKRGGIKEKDVFFKFYTSRQRSLFKTYDHARIKLIESKKALKKDKPLKGARLFLSILCTRHNLYLVTLRYSRKNLSWELKRLKFCRYFKKVLSAPAGKNPANTKYRLLKRCIPDGKGLIIGDTEADILAGKMAGVFSCAVLSGIRSKKNLRALGPDFLIRNIKGANKVISKLEEGIHDSVR